MLPERFEEQHIRVYSKLRDAATVNSLRLGFADWCLRHGFESPKVCRNRLRPLLMC